MYGWPGEPAKHRGQSLTHWTKNNAVIDGQQDSRLHLSGDIQYYKRM